MALSGSSTVRLKWGQDRLDARDHGATVGFERVGHVVELQPNRSRIKRLAARFRTSLSGIVEHLPPRDEAGAENAVEAFFDLAKSARRLRSRRIRRP